MDRREHAARRDNVIGEYAHAGLGLAFGLISGILATVLWHSISLGLALGVALGLVLEVVFEMADRRSSPCLPGALGAVREERRVSPLRHRHRMVLRH